jgi:hypothetical protein
MVRHSSLQSVSNFEISRLAIFECAFVLLLHVALGLYFRTYLFFAVSIVLTPVTVLRTKVSVRWALAWYQRAWAWRDRSFDYFAPWYIRPGERVPTIRKGERLRFLAKVTWGVLSVGIVALIGVALRTIGPPIWAVRKFFSTLLTMPKNFYQQCLCIDVRTPLEIVPGEAAMPTRVPGLEHLWRNFHASMSNPIIWRTGPFCLALLITLVALSSALYRLAVKSTLVAYLPVVLIVAQTVNRPLTLRRRLVAITSGAFEKNARKLAKLFLSPVAITLAGIRVGVVDIGGFVKIIPGLNEMDIACLVTSWSYLLIPLITAIIATAILYFVADAALTRLEHGDAWPESYLVKTLATISLIRAVAVLLMIGYPFFVSFSALLTTYFSMPPLVGKTVLCH